MKLFDAHCHLPAVAKAMAGTPDDSIFPMFGKLIDRATAADVVAMAVCIDFSNVWKQAEPAPLHFSNVWKECFQGLEKYPQVFPNIGIHPWFVGCRAGAVTPPETAPKLRGGYSRETDFQCLKKLLLENPGAGIGETGLDFSSFAKAPADRQDRFENRTEQEECFAAHLDLARELNRPVTVHCVQAWGRLVKILKKHPAPRILLHAYSGSAELMPELVNLNCSFSFGPAVMNPNAKRARAAIAAVPEDRFLIETDSEGEPEKLIEIARAVAELRGVSVEEIADLTFKNARRFFSR